MGIAEVERLCGVCWKAGDIRAAKRSRVDRGDGGDSTISINNHFRPHWLTNAL
jgi:hypothetical protein